jgi:choline dehydrogenase-like flavoprotein
VTEVLAADAIVVGAGIAGLLVARELVAAGRETVLLERGGHMSHDEQLLAGRHEQDLPTALHNHEAAPGTEPYAWDYAYGVGGSTLHWTGVAARLLPADFELRSRHGIAVDWPLAYDDLAPYYEQAEQALAVAGGANPLLPGTDGPPLPPHPFSPVDEALRPLLAPYESLPQSRPTVSVDGRPACCGSARCRLCPVDARFSALHLWDRELAGRDGLTLRTGAVVARVAVDAGRVRGVEGIQSSGERLEARAPVVVLAAGGIENAATLMRSGLGGDEVGRRLFDHAQRAVEIELETPVGSGAGSTLATGVSYAFADGEWRDRRASFLVTAYNPGLFPTRIAEELARGLAAGEGGAAARERIRDRLDRTLVLSFTGEDLPDPARRVELSPRRDALGLPLNRIAYGPDSQYVEAAWQHLLDELPQRLASLGVRSLRPAGATVGAHQLGTCPIGLVVDEDLRVRVGAGLYAVGGSAFPTYGAAWPTLTIAALALRLGALLARA